MAEFLEVDTAMPMADVGTVAVIEPVKRGFLATQEIEVYSAKKQRPDFSSSEREEIINLLQDETSLALYEPQRATIIRARTEIERFKKDLENVHKKDVTIEKYRQKIADLRLLITEREAEHDDALWEIRQQAFQFKQMAYRQVVNLANEAQQQVTAVSHQAEQQALQLKQTAHQQVATITHEAQQQVAAASHLAQQQMAAASHQAQLQQAQLVQEGTMIIMEKERQINELQRTTAAEILSLKHGKEGLERRIDYLTTTSQQQQQQYAVEAQRLGNVIAELNNKLQNSQEQAQHRLDDLSKQMLDLSSTHSATVDSNQEERRQQQQTSIERETLVNKQQAQLTILQQQTNAQLALAHQESMQRESEAAEVRHRLQQAEATNAHLSTQHNMEAAQLQQAAVLKDAEIRRLQAQLQAQLQAAAATTTTPAVFNVNVPRTPQAETVQPLVKGLTELVSHQHKLGIPYFSGYLHEPSIEEWLREAERVARTAGWDEEMKIRFFGDRLRHMALAVHEDLHQKWVKPNYAQWKAAMHGRFQDKSAKDSYKRALEMLSQKPTQRAMDFGSQIDEVYKKAYGASAAASTDPDVTLIREDVKKRVLYKGLREMITNQMWVSPSASYQEHLQKAIDVEEMLSRKHSLTVAPTLPAVTNVAASDDKFKAIIEKLDKLNINDQNRIPQGRSNYGTNQQTWGALRRQYQQRPLMTYSNRPVVNNRDNRPTSDQPPFKRPTTGKADLREVICYQCHAKGHYKKDCRAQPSAAAK